MKTLIETLDEIARWYNIATATIYKINGKTVASLTKNIKPFERELEYLMNTYHPLPHSLALHYDSDFTKLNEYERKFYNDRLNDTFRYLHSSIRFFNEDITTLIAGMKAQVNAMPQFYALNFVRYHVGIDAYKLENDEDYKKDVTELLKKAGGLWLKDYERKNPLLKYNAAELEVIGSRLANYFFIEKKDVRNFAEKLTNPDSAIKKIVWRNNMKKNPELRYLIEGLAGRNMNTALKNLCNKVFETPNQMDLNTRAKAWDSNYLILQPLYT